MNWPGYQKAMDDLLSASITHHAAESAVFAAKREMSDVGGVVAKEIMDNLDKASIDLRSSSRIYASLHKKIADNKSVIVGASG